MTGKDDLVKRKMPGIWPVDLAAPAARFLATAAAALAVWLDGRSIELPLIYLGAAYAAIALISVPVAVLSRGWPAYLLAPVDVGAVTAFIVLSPLALPSLWVLYLLPIAGAAAVGHGPAAVAAGLALAGYLAATWLTAGTIPLDSLWPATLLAAVGFLAIGLARPGPAAREERRAWREIIAAARALRGGGSAEDVARVILRQARLLARADGAWLYWCDETGELIPGPRAGCAPEQLKTIGPMVEAMSRKIERASVPLADLGDTFDGLVGDAVALRDRERLVAFLVVAWKRSPRGRKTLLDRVRIFAPWAADALIQAEARTAAREELRREQVLRQAMADLAATLDRERSWQVVVEAARTGLGATAAIVDRSSGHVVAGNAEAPEALVRSPLGASATEQGVATRDLPAGKYDETLIVPIEEDLVVRAWQSVRRFGKPDGVWLSRLATLAKAALERCGDHARLQHEEHWLRVSLSGLPAPLAVRDGAGRLLLTNAAHEALGLAAPRDEPSLEATREEETVVGNPPRAFVLATVPLEEGRFWVSLYREVTREREALRAKEELISFLAHELRSPLTSILGYSQMMARQLGVVQGQVNQLNRLVGDVMDAARLESGQLALNRRPVEPSELVQQALDRFRGAHPTRVVRLENADAPPVQGDPVRLGQVLDNLLSNAAKYSPEDREIVLRVGTDGDGRVVLAVRDSGTGIAPEHLPHLFERFYRVPDAGAKGVKGFGLGLAIVHDLVAAHGGRVWAESAGAGRGSTFHVALPAAPRDEAAQPGQLQAANRP